MGGARGSPKHTRRKQNAKIGSRKAFGAGTRYSGSVADRRRKRRSDFPTQGRSL